MNKKTYWKIRHGYLWGAVLAFFALCFTGCKDDDVDAGVPFDPSKPIVISDFMPKSGGYGSNLILYGENFGNDASRIQVTVGGKVANVINVKSNSLYCVVPSKAYEDSEGYGHIQVSGLDENGEVIVTGEAAQQFQYQKQWLVTTAIGTHYTVSSDFVEKEGPFSNCGGFEGLEWFSWDPLSNFTRLYACAHTPRLRLFDFEGSDPENPESTEKGYASFVYFTDCAKVCNINCTADDAKDMIVGDATGHTATDESIRQYYRSTGFTTNRGLAAVPGINGVIVHPIDGDIYCSQYYEQNIMRYDWETGELKQAFLNDRSKMTTRMVVHPTGKYAYFVHQVSNYIGRSDYDEANQTFTPAYRVCGSGSGGFKDGVGSQAQINTPEQGVFVKNEEYVAAGADDVYDFYFCDSKNHCIRKLTPQGRVTLFAGRGNNGTSGYADGELTTEARFNLPKAIAYSEREKCFYVGDCNNKVIRKIALEE